MTRPLPTYGARVRHGDRLWEAAVPDLGVRRDGFVSEAAAWRWAAGQIAHALVLGDLAVRDYENQVRELTELYPLTATN